MRTVIFPIVEENNTPPKNTVSSKKQNNAIMRMLETTCKKQHDVNLVEPNDVVSDPVSQIQYAQIHVGPPT